MILNVKKDRFVPAPFCIKKTTGFLLGKPVEIFFSRSWQLR